jgi:hypothetical protein
VEKAGLSFTIAAGPRKCNNSRVRVHETHDHTLLSDTRLSQPGGPGPCIYILQEQGGPVIAEGTEFPFRRLARLFGIRWKYYTSDCKSTGRSVGRSVGQIIAGPGYKTSSLIE